ncbi:peptidoglycan-binding domain-containing protein [Streptomyces sp. NPDC091212]|uniref:peptidoglycan-binding domain-containing protein n=1 Tax=Streptomyces sp. NPDC091212 TaxID=3155191 RepID=UPI00343BCBBD
MTGSSEQRPPARRGVLEPTHVMRPRRPKPLSDFGDLFRPEGPEDGRGEGWERVAVAGPGAAQDAQETEELPPVPPQVPPATARGALPGGPPRADGRRWSGRATALVAVAGAAVAGFAAALLLTWNGTQEEPPATAPPPATASTAPEVPADPAPGVPGAGALRQGDSGPEVREAQERLLRIPDVYAGGSVDGVYDTTFTEAVGRFQLWYGIRGDETGVYGENTRRDLESRTGS